MSPTNIEDKAMALKSNQWEDLYILAEHWESDLKFYSDDLRFLHHLVDKYFIWITKSENLELVRESRSDVHCRPIDFAGRRFERSRIRHLFRRR